MSHRRVLVVLGKNWRRSPFGLSLESKMNALAAAELYAAGRVDHLLFSGGRTAGRDRQSEAEAMYLFLRRFYGADRIPDTAVLLEDRSIDTAGNAEQAAATLARLGIQEVGLLTVECHLPAATLLFAAYGVKPCATFAAEAILRQRSPHHAALLQRYRRSPRARLDRVRERIRRALLPVDPAGRLLRPVTSLLRR
ncbi:MAG: YdcF family protein [Chloroflexi bacterium]|nr:YdcF family protein [Chloroflexota bacterium]